MRAAEHNSHQWLFSTRTHLTIPKTKPITHPEFYVIFKFYGLTRGLVGRNVAEEMQSPGSLPQSRITRTCTHMHARVHVHAHTSNGAPVVYTHSVLHWSSLREIGDSSVLAAGASGIVYKTSGSCHAFQSSSGLLSRFHPPSSFPTLVSFVPLTLFAFLSLYPKSGFLLLSFPSLSPSLRFSPPSLIVYRRRPDARQQGRLYVLLRLSVARLPRRFPIYFRILPLATRRDVTRPGCALSQCNTIKSKPRYPVMGSGTRVRSTLTYLHSRKKARYIWYVPMNFFNNLTRVNKCRKKCDSRWHMH